jgi:hypothetical protein
MNHFADNINFFLEEKIQENDNSSEIEKMLLELEDTEYQDTEYNLTSIKDATNIYNNEDFYEDCNIKQLLKICNYYDIEKTVKMAKYKKQDIISSIVYFESLQENYEIVNNRHKMWSYIVELMNDSKMKKYIIWD